jgi:hypothetical protein
MSRAARSVDIGNGLGLIPTELETAGQVFAFSAVGWHVFMIAVIVIGIGCRVNSCGEWAARAEHLSKLFLLSQFLRGLHLYKSACRRHLLSCAAGNGRLECRIRIFIFVV